MQRTTLPPIPEPTTTGRSGAGAITAAIRHLHHQLATAPTLQPDRAVDGLFRRLVHLVVTTPAEAAAAVLADPAVQVVRPHLVELCGRGEHLLELAWGRRVAASSVPSLALARFPYLDNYRQLTQLELATVAQHLTRPLRRVLFVGSGPLPLSSLFYAGHLDAPIDNIDSDACATATARTLAHRLGARQLAFHHRELTDCDDLDVYDLVVLAALVGRTPDQKRHYVRHLQRAMAPGALLLARSADGLRTLLYPAIDPAHLHDDGWDLLAVAHPTGPVINSAILARKPPL